jgi:DNA-binding transcriptional regulator GbsR (MarR family)
MTGDAHTRAIALAAETMSEIVAFWGFKPSLGRIWSLLYLAGRPLSADEIAEHTGMSTGAVSMAINELLQWEIIVRASVPGDRKRHYTAETDVLGMIRRIIEQRELRMVGRAVGRFEEALALVEQARLERPDDRELVVVAERLRGLLVLARVGYGLVDGLARRGILSLLPIRGQLAGDASAK